MWKSGWKINKDWVKGKEKWMLLLVCGLILLILSFPPGSKKDKEEEAGAPVVQGQLVPEAKEGDSDSQTAAGKISGTQEDEERRYEKEMEQRVKDILKNVDGVGEVDVMLTLKSSKEKACRQGQEPFHHGGKRQRGRYQKITDRGDERVVTDDRNVGNSGAGN